MSKIDISFRKTVLKSDLPFVIQNFGEVSWDTLCDDGIFKSIPILGTIFAIGKIFGNVIDYFFAKKIIAFLRSLSSLSETERQQLIHRLDTDEKFSKYAGEQIIELLSRIDSDRKAVLVATALKFYVRGEIDSLQLQRINYAIDRFMLCDAEEFLSFTTRKRFKDNNPATANFINAGLAYTSSHYDGGGISLNGDICFLNETGLLFLQVLDEGLQ